MTTVDTVVLGGGISGLAAAWYVAREGHRVLVLDRRAKPGGRMQSERRNGFLMEHGPTSFVAPAPTAEALIAAADLAGQTIERDEAVRHRYLVRQGRVRALGLTPGRFFLSPFFSLAGRLRLLAEPMIPAHSDDETVSDFVRRRFGNELHDYVFDALVGGLYAGDPERLSMDAVFPQLKALERRHGSVAWGILRARLARSGPSTTQPGPRRLFSFRDGMGALPRVLADALGDQVRSGTMVEAVLPRPNGGFRIKLRAEGETHWLTTGSVVMALPAYAAARVLRPLNSPVAAGLDAIHHPPLAVVFLGYRRGDIDHPLDGLGYLAPHVERRPALGMLFNSTLFAGRAPEGHVALTAFIGGTRRPELATLPPDELVALAAEEAGTLLGGRVRPVTTHVRLWPRALPQLGLDHAAYLRDIHRLETEHPGLVFAGNYLSGVSTAACIDNAARAATRIIDHLRMAPSERRASA